MQERQKDRKQYFEEQRITTEKYVIPYINETVPVTAEMKIAEIGCGDGGNLLPFLDKGCTVVGIDISTAKISLAESFFENHPLRRNLKLIARDIYEIKDDINFKFDLIVMRDSLEHIPHQDVLLDHIKTFLNPNGKIFLSFPAWRMPFGGHQQMCKSKFLSKLPYFHIFPNFLYRLILKLSGESQNLIDGLMEVKETRISIQKFKHIVLKGNYVFDNLTYYLINPNYEVKFRLKPRRLPAILNIIFLRDFFVTTIYCVISLKQ
jgi:SAM-dependent methyltransferase